MSENVCVFVDTRTVLLDGQGGGVKARPHTNGRGGSCQPAPGAPPPDPPGGAREDLNPERHPCEGEPEGSAQELDENGVLTAGSLHRAAQLRVAQPTDEAQQPRQRPDYQAIAHAPTHGKDVARGHEEAATHDTTDHQRHSVHPPQLMIVTAFGHSGGTRSLRTDTGQLPNIRKGSQRLCTTVSPLL